MAQLWFGALTLLARLLILGSPGCYYFKTAVFLRYFAHFFATAGTIQYLPS